MRTLAWWVGLTLWAVVGWLLLAFAIGILWTIVDH